MLNEIKVETVELVFDSCETITVGVDAIKSFDFTVSGEDYCWDNRRKVFDVQKNLSKFHLILDIHDLAGFAISDPVHIERGMTEREYLTKRLITTRDITHVYINGIAYRLPWLGHSYNNLGLRTIVKPITLDGQKLVEYLADFM